MQSVSINSHNHMPWGNADNPNVILEFRIDSLKVLFK